MVFRVQLPNRKSYWSTCSEPSCTRLFWSSLQQVDNQYKVKAGTVVCGVDPNEWFDWSTK